MNGTANETKVVSALHVPLQSLHSFLSRIQGEAAWRGVLLGVGVAKNVSL